MRLRADGRDDMRSAATAYPITMAKRRVKKKFRALYPSGVSLTRPTPEERDRHPCGKKSGLLDALGKAAMMQLVRVKRGLAIHKYV